MPKIRYSAKENKRVGTHSYYAQGYAEAKNSGYHEPTDEELAERKRQAEEQE